MVGGGEQRRALETVLHTLDLEELAIPEEIWRTLPPRPFRYPAHRELFDRYTGSTFDVISPAVAVTEHVTRLLLDEERAARLVEQAALDPELPDLAEVREALRRQVFDQAPADPYLAEIQRAVQRVVVDELIQLATAASMPQVGAVVEWELVGLGDLMAEAHEDAARREDAGAAAHHRALATDIGRHLDRRVEPAEVPGQLRIPPGSPIG